MTPLFAALRRGIWTPALLLLASCSVQPPPHEGSVEGNPEDEDIYVREDPPPPRQEIEIGTAPGGDYLWAQGYWAWHHSHWYWVRGRWVARPQPRAEWVPGHWQRRERGYHWVPGRWRR